MNFIFNQEDVLVNVDAISHINKTSNGSANVYLINNQILTEFAEFNDVVKVINELSRRKTKVDCEDVLKVKVVNK